MLTDKEVKECVEHCILKLIKEFIKYPYRFGSEGDLRCYLFHIICKKLPQLLKPIPLLDDEGEFKDCLIHSESKFQITKNKSYDVVIFPQSLLHKEIPLVVIELKWEHFSHMSLKKYPTRSFLKDISKLNKIKSHPKFIGYSIIFNKDMDTSFKNSFQERTFQKEIRKISLQKIKIYYIGVFQDMSFEFLELRKDKTYECN